jgi:ribosomal protein S12 methylthiotransferase accessory factor
MAGVAASTLGTSPAAALAHPPIRFRGQSHTARKEFWEGTQRIRSPAETLEIIRPYFRRIGLTRLADITGLDRIGIRTVLSIRPNSAYLSVDAGKGFTLEAAMVSAAMECVERFSAETAELPCTRASYERMAAEHDIVPFGRLPLAKHALFRPTWSARWTLGWDLIAQRDVAAPTLLVAMDSYYVRQSELNPFQTGSNGLASGNNFLEAVTGGLLELVERDAVACQRVAWERLARPIPRVRLDTIEHPAVRDLLERFATAVVTVVLFDCTVDTGIPVYMAYIYDERSRHVGIYRGYGAHLDPGIAMVRALTEAVQARSIFIAGSRDDFFRHDYLRLKQGDDAASIQRLQKVPAEVDARARASLATETFEGDVTVILDRLRAVSIDQAVVFDLTKPGFDDVSALRVIVPGLEGYMFDYYTPGPRALAFLAELRR